MFLRSRSKDSGRAKRPICARKRVCFASQVQSVQSRKRRLLHTQAWGKAKVNTESPITITCRHHHHLITMSHHRLNVPPPTRPSTSPGLRSEGPRSMRPRRLAHGSQGLGCAFLLRRLENFWTEYFRRSRFRSTAKDGGNTDSLSARLRWFASKSVAVAACGSPVRNLTAHRVIQSLSSRTPRSRTASGAVHFVPRCRL